MIGLGGQLLKIDILLRAEKPSRKCFGGSHVCGHHLPLRRSRTVHIKNEKWQWIHVSCTTKIDALIDIPASETSRPLVTLM